MLIQDQQKILIQDQQKILIQEHVSLHLFAK